MWENCSESEGLFSGKLGENWRLSDIQISKWTIFPTWKVPISLKFSIFSGKLLLRLNIGKILLFFANYTELFPINLIFGQKKSIKVFNLV